MLRPLGCPCPPFLTPAAFSLGSQLSRTLPRHPPPLSVAPRPLCCAPVYKRTLRGRLMATCQSSAVTHEHLGGRGWNFFSPLPQCAAPGRSKAGDQERSAEGCSPPPPWCPVSMSLSICYLLSRGGLTGTADVLPILSQGRLTSTCSSPGPGHLQGSPALSAAGLGTGGHSGTAWSMCRTGVQVALRLLLNSLQTPPRGKRGEWTGGPG